MTHDNIRSTRGVFDQSKALAGEFAFTPYGGNYTSHGNSAFRLFTGKPYDTTSGTYFFPYRYYNDHTARWISRDPLGMVDGPNVYAYVKNAPTLYADYLGRDVIDDILNGLGIAGCRAFCLASWAAVVLASYSFLTVLALLACAIQAIGTWLEGKDGGNFSP